MIIQRKFLAACTVALLITCVVPAVGRAQEFIAAQPEILSGNATLIPLNESPGAGNRFISNPLGAGPYTGLRSAGIADGRGVSSLGSVQFGFDYLRPTWTHRDFTLVVPGAAAGSFPLLGDTGHVDSQFVLAPRINYDYYVEDIDFGIHAMGTFLNLNGRLNQEVNGGPAGQGTLTAISNLTIVTAIVPECSTRVYYSELLNHNKFYCSLFDDLVIDAGIGTRYSSISQNYNSSLTNNLPGSVNNSIRYSTQSFRGIGLATRLDFSCPLKNDWVLFNNFRGSLLIGDNNKNSSLSVTVGNQNIVTDTINQNETAIIPIVEYSFGLEWGHNLGNALRDTGVPQPRCTIRTAFVSQFWGDVGPLSAGSPQRFSNSDLFLLGAHVMVGFQR